MRRHHRAQASPLRRLALLVPTLLLVVACGGTDDGSTDGDDQDDGVEVPADDGAQPGTQPPPDGEDDPSGGSDPLLGPEIEVAMEDLTSRLEVDREAVDILVTELVSWPDGALGCPQDDEMYTQAVVDGYRIVLAVDGEEYAYHGAQGEDPFPCEDPVPPLE